MKASIFFAICTIGKIIFTSTYIFSIYYVVCNCLSFTFQIAFFNGGYVFPLLLICGMYSIMLRRLWRQGPAGQASAESIRNKKRVVKMVLVVIVIFALSWLPIQVVLVLRYVIIISGWVFMKLLGFLLVFWKNIIQYKIDLIFSRNSKLKSKNFAQVRNFFRLF